MEIDKDALETMIRRVVRDEIEKAFLKFETKYTYTYTTTQPIKFKDTFPDWKSYEVWCESRCKNE